MIFYLSKIQGIIGYEFKNSELLRSCFTHASYANEHGHVEYNERLEFLGDSVLGLIVNENFYNRKDKLSEGDMTSLKQKYVSTTPLSQAIRRLGLEKYMLLGEGVGNPTDKICEDLFEALVAGLYLDGGLEVARNFVQKNLIELMDKEIKEEGKKAKNVKKKEEETKVTIDYKSELNEYCQKKLKCTPTYKQISKTGTDHNPLFIMAAVVKGNIIAQGEGSSKRVAEQEAAKKTLNKLKKKKG